MNSNQIPSVLETIFAGWFARQVRKVTARTRRRILVGVLLAAGLSTAWALASTTSSHEGMTQLAVGIGLCLMGWFICKYAKRIATRRVLQRRRWARLLPFLRSLWMRPQPRDVMIHFFLGYICFCAGLLVSVVGLKLLLLH